MRVTIQRDTTTGELVQEIQGRYGSKAELARYVDEHPDDWDAKVALHDLEEYTDEPQDKRLEDTREVIVPDSAIDELTFRRLTLLLQLKRFDGKMEGIRSLSRALDRDVKNVSQDVKALHEIGLLKVQEQGVGRPHIVSLPGNRIGLHILEAEA